MWKLVLVSIAAARALPSSLSSADSLEPTQRALDEMEEEAQSVGNVMKRLGDADKVSVGGIGRKVGPSPSPPRRRRQPVLSRSTAGSGPLRRSLQARGAPPPPRPSPHHRPRRPVA